MDTGVRTVVCIVAKPVLVLPSALSCHAVRFRQCTDIVQLHLIINRNHLTGISNVLAGQQLNVKLASSLPGEGKSKDLRKGHWTLHTSAGIACESDAQSTVTSSPVPALPTECIVQNQVAYTGAKSNTNESECTPAKYMLPMLVVRHQCLCITMGQQ